MLLSILCCHLAWVFNFIVIHTKMLLKISMDYILFFFLVFPSKTTDLLNECASLIRQMLNNLPLLMLNTILITASILPDFKWVSTTAINTCLSCRVYVTWLDYLFQFSTTHLPSTKMIKDSIANIIYALG